MVMVDKSALKIPRPNPVDPGRLPAKFPKIEIDHTKCTVPFWCKKCLQICPQVVFQVYCKQIQKFKETDPRLPGMYEIIPVRRDKCIMCDKCKEVCPEGAITITF
jgi:formate hydrogenlyase subunit 6/NADH:ubiquinone oxidoreductase subunit I